MRLGHAIGALLLSAALLTGCGYSETTIPEPATDPTTAAPGPELEDCENGGRRGPQVASYAPDSGPTLGTAVRRIRESNRLVVGVAADTELLAARNAETGDIEGFDIDFAFEVAQALWPEDSRSQLESKVVLRVITAADRIPFIQDGTVDIVVRNMTVNCERWQQVAFSAIYYDAGQKVLVGKGQDLDTIEDLAGKRICAPAGTTSIENIQQIQPDAIPVTSTDNSACMVLFQNGEADGVSTDDTVLAGLAAQDPYAEVMKTEFLTDEPYGIAVNSENDDLVRLINARLEEIRRNGRWQEIYNQWLRPQLGVPGVQPEPVYGREG